MKAAVTARFKLKVTLRFPASGDSFSSLALLCRIPPCTISRFFTRNCNRLSSHWIALWSYVWLNCY